MDMVVPADSAIGLISSVMSSKFLMEAWSAHKKTWPDSVIRLIWSCENKKRENGLECDLMVFSAANVSIFGSELHLHHPRGVHHLSVFSGQWPFTMKAPVPSIGKKKHLIWPNQGSTNVRGYLFASKNGWNQTPCNFFKWHNFPSVS